MLANHHEYLLETGSFNWGLYIDLLLCIIGYSWKVIKLYVFDPFHLQMSIKLYRKYKPVRITQKEHLLIWNSETTQNLNIYLYNYQTETAIFPATKHEKTIMTCTYLKF